MLPDVVFVRLIALARLPVSVSEIPAPALTVRLLAPAAPMVSVPPPLTAPVVAPLPVVDKVRLFGVVTALLSVIVPPPVCSVQAPDGLVTPVTAPSVEMVPLCATSPIVSVPV